MAGHPYEQIVNDLRAAILGGPLPSGHKPLTAGQQLPSENELRERYGVSRNTVQRALDDLVAQGLVISEPKRGTFVRVYERQRHPTRLDLANREFGARVSVETVTAPPALHAQEPDAPWVFCRRMIGQRISETYWARSVTDAISELSSPEPLPHTEVELLIRAGIRITRGQATTIARMPTAQESMALNLPPATPVIEQMTVLQAGERMLAVRVEVWPGDRYALVYDLTPDYPEESTVGR